MTTYWTLRKKKCHIGQISLQSIFMYLYDDVSWSGFKSCSILSPSTNTHGKGMLCNFENEATDFIHTLPTLSRQLRNKKWTSESCPDSAKRLGRFTPMCRCAYFGCWGSLWRTLDIWLVNTKLLLLLKPSFFSTFLFEAGGISPLQKDFIKITSYPNPIFSF